MIFWRKIDLLWVSISLNAWHLSLGERLRELGILFGGDWGRKGYCRIWASVREPFRGQRETLLHEDFC